jgi:SAM-dependent methyltransferase
MTQQADSLTPDYSVEYYQRLAEVADSGLPSHRLRLGWLDRMLPVGPAARVADFGSGAGTIARHLGTKGAQVDSVDLSPNAIECCRRRCAHLPNVRFHQGDAGNCPHLPSGVFDCATCMDLIEHVDDATMRGIFREARRVLKPGGLLYVYSPNRLHWIERLKARSLLLRQDPSHTNVRTVAQVAASLSGEGFEVVRVARPASMVPVVRAIEWLWARQPIAPWLAVYRVCLLARRPEGAP